MKSGGEEEEEIVCLDESFFVNRNYEITTFSFGSNEIRLFCLNSASTDYDLTGQLVWPGAVLMNNYLSENAAILEGRSMIELGSGVGITGLLCGKFCSKVVLTDHNDEVLEIIRKNIELQTDSGALITADLEAEKLEWGSSEHIINILQKYPEGFDLILGADICFQQCSVPPLFHSVEKLFRFRRGQCKFILAYVSRAKSMDVMVIDEAHRHGMQVNEVRGTRTQIRNLEGVIYEITLK